MKRRSLLLAAGVATIAPLAKTEIAKRRVAVIGHTGRGNFGHGLDTVWLKIPETEIVAIADGDEAGLLKELEKLNWKIDEGFSHYDLMLEKIRPEFVAVCPRYADQHRDMCLAAIEAGAKGIYVEKPFVRTPAEADELIAACEKHGTKIAVAHRNRYHPALAVIDQLIADGKIGRLLEIRGRGKGDRRGGGEDLWVLGSHVLNLVHYFGGDPLSCSAVMMQDGKPVTKADVRDGAEGLGLLAGNELHARYEMSDGVIATFDSIANDGSGGAGFGLQLVGSEGIVNIQCDRDPVAQLIPGNPFKPDFAKARPWIPITAAGAGKEETPEQKAAVAEVHNHVAPVRDLIEAVDSDREPLCGVKNGAVTVEMICAVFESQRQGGKAVPFPLEQRENALANL